MQLRAVWCLRLIGDTEGPTLIAGATWLRGVQPLRLLGTPTTILTQGGDLILKDSERIQPQGGRLDLLLQNAESSNRFEVEIQLGRTDESHIIRTIEYWDVERKRYPQYDTPPSLLRRM